MSETPTQFAPANAVDVRETNILHASDVVYWLDGSTAVDSNDMQRINTPLALEFSTIPRDVRVLERLGKTAFWRRPNTAMIEGRASQAQRTRSAETNFNVVGNAWDFSRQYNPIHFDLSLGNGTGHAIVIYPTPNAISIPPAGCVFGRLLREDNQSPVLWALLELSIEVSSEDTLIIRGQSDSKGDFLLPLKKLPPLPSGEVNYPAQLSVSANLSNSESNAPDPSSYTAFNLESGDTAESFVAAYDIDLVPGEYQRIQSAEKSFLAMEVPA